MSLFKGPVVKSGPTKGQVRSRNKDGRWRKKRSDVGKQRGLSSEMLDFAQIILEVCRCYVND